MKKTLLFLSILVVFLFCATGVSALSITINNDYFLETGSSHIGETITFSYRVRGYDYLTTRDWYIGYKYGREYDNYSGITVPGVERCIIGRGFNDSRRIHVTGDGEYTVTVNSDDIPFDNLEYMMYVVLYSVDANDNKLNDIYVTDYMPFVLTPYYTGDAREVPDSGLWVALRDAFPNNGNAYAANVVNEHIYYRMTMFSDTKESVQVGIAVGSGSTYPYKLIAKGIRTVTFQPNGYIYSDYEQMFFGENHSWYYFEGLNWTAITGGGSLTNASVWEENHPYCHLVGIPINDPDGHTNINDPDKIWLTADNTMSFNLHPSIDTVNNHIDNGGWGHYAYDYDYAGYFAQFQTYGGQGYWFDTGYTDSGFGQSIKNWGASIGMPWFWMLIVLLIIGIFTCIPLIITFKFNINLPNVIYALFIIIGVVTTYYIGLLELWMFALFIIVVAIAIISKYHEQIENFYTEHVEPEPDFIREGYAFGKKAVKPIYEHERKLWLGERGRLKKGIGKYYEENRTKIKRPKRRESYYFPSREDISEEKWYDIARRPIKARKINPFKRNGRHYI